MNPRSSMQALFALAVVLLSSGANAQGTVTDSPTGRRSDAVNVPFFAEGSHGSLRTGITTADLSILDNQKPPQSVVSIRGAKELPLRLGVLIDTSNSESTSRLY